MSLFYWTSLSKIYKYETNVYLLVYLILKKSKENMKRKPYREYTA